MVTVGKYPRPHTVYVPTEDSVVTPFALKQYRLEMFKRVRIDMTQNSIAPLRVHRSFALWKEGKPYPAPAIVQR